MNEHKSGIKHEGITFWEGKNSRQAETKIMLLANTERKKASERITYRKPDGHVDHFNSKRKARPKDLPVSWESRSNP